MRTCLYHKNFPLGKVFDTERDQEDAHVSTAPTGSVDSPDKLNVTTDQIVEAAVKQELAKQSTDRPEMDKDFERVTGAKPHFAAKDETVVKAIDEAPRKSGRPKGS